MLVVRLARHCNALFALFFVGSVFFLGPVIPFVAALDPVEELQQQINETQKQLQLSLDATKPLEGEVERLAARIKSAENTVAQLDREQKETEKSIALQEENLKDQYQLFSHRVDEQYRYQRTTSPLVALLHTLEQNTNQRQAAKYVLTLAERDKGSITKIGQEIVDLQNAKQAAAARAAQLKVASADLAKQKAFFDKEIAGAKNYQSQLNSKIAALNARQQEILSEKTGTAQTSVGEVPLTGDPNSRLDFNPGFSPAFAVFSFGAPHYKGMSQYGAYGRAKSGQNSEAILKAYYGNVKIEKVDTPGSISVDGVGSIPFEDQYLKGIAEMPSQWAEDGGYEALKAQAIAARTYALSYGGWRMSDRNLKKGICATESCQVYKSSKFQAGGRWHDAVNDTRGMVVVSNTTNDIFATWYASTSGGHQLGYTSLGHTTPNFWDSTSNWTKWADGAYEKVSGSPWFYMAWYKSRGGDSCGRSHPWLTQDEFTDILNSWVVRRAGGGDADRVSPLGACWGGNPFSISEMRDRARSAGEEYTSVSSVRVEHSESGNSSRVILQTNRGEVSIPAQEFKDTFNLRAPGRIAVKGKLFGIEKK